MKQLSRAKISSGQSTTSAIAIGLAVTLVVSILLSAGLTSLVINGNLNENSVRISVFVIRTISVLLGGLVGASLSKGKYLPIVGIIALIYAIVLIGFGIIFYDGSFQNFGFGMLSMIIGGALACIIKLKPLRKPRRTVKYGR